MLASLCVTITKTGWTVADPNWPPCFYSSSTMVSSQDRQSDLSKTESDHRISLLELSRAFSVQLAHCLKCLFMTEHSLPVQVQLCNSSEHWGHTPSNHCASATLAVCLFLQSISTFVLAVPFPWHHLPADICTTLLLWSFMFLCKYHLLGGPS